MIGKYLFLVFFFVSLNLSWAASKPEQLEGVGITEKLGNLIKINEFKFRDEKNEEVLLSKYFQKGRPVMLALIYYQCPNLCNLMFNGLVDSLKKLDWTVGNQFELVTVSINPQETPSLAVQKKEGYLRVYNRPKSSKGWHFLTGEENQIQALANEVGFQYRYDEKEKQYVHAAVLFVLTPEGKISRYLYGISFHPQNLRLSLVEASNGKVGTIVDRVLLFCFHFDPNKNSYTLHMWRVVQLVLSAQILGIGIFLYFLWKKHR